MRLFKFAIFSVCARRTGLRGDHPHCLHALYGSAERLQAAPDAPRGSSRVRKLALRVALKTSQTAECCRANSLDSRDHCRPDGLQDWWHCTAMNSWANGRKKQMHTQSCPYSTPSACLVEGAEGRVHCGRGRGGVQLSARLLCAGRHRAGPEQLAPRRGSPQERTPLQRWKRVFFLF